MARDPEVDEHRPLYLSLHQEDVAGLDITMDDAAPVEYLEYVLNNREVHVPYFEGIANQCEGVFETLNMITKMLIHKYLNK